MRHHFGTATTDESLVPLERVERTILILRGHRKYAALRSQFATLKTGRGEHRKYPPRVFTEHGALMAASVLSSPKAVEMSIFVVRAFVRLRRILAANRKLAAKLNELERRIAAHDKNIVALFQAVRALMAVPEKPKRRIGFNRDRA